MRILRRLSYLLVTYLLVVMMLSVAYRVVPPVSAFMVASALRGDGAERHWVPLRAVSPNLIRALIVSEDTRFCVHHGIDWHSVDKALDENRRNGPRGASTLTMQVAKNLFFWNGRSWVRKALEAPMALWIDFVMPKRREMEIYLNIAEWGDGVFGIEAAARHQFGVHASQLTAEQSALLVTMLPDPEHRNAASPGFGHLHMSWQLSDRIAHEGANTGCLSPSARKRY